MTISHCEGALRPAQHRPVLSGDLDVLDGPPSWRQRGRPQPIDEAEDILDLDNPDPKYKQAVLQLLSDAYDIATTERVGELELVIEDGTTVKCDLVLMSNWPTQLPNEFLNG